MAIRILIVDDDTDLAENIADWCEDRGWEARTADSAKAADAAMAEHRFDAMVLDVTMPWEDGVSFCRRLREAGCAMPVIMLTANSKTDEKLAGLMSGADDYMTKPFSLRELGARIETVLRRIRPTVLRVEDLEFDTESMRVTRAGNSIELKITGLRILRELMKRSPEVVERADLEKAVWGGEPPDSDSLRANIYLLRQQIDRPYRRQLIRTHTGIGWSIGQTPPDPASKGNER